VLLVLALGREKGHVVLALLVWTIFSGERGKHHLVSVERVEVGATLLLFREQAEAALVLVINYRL